MRIKIFNVTAENFGRVFRSGERFEVEKGIPETGKVVRAGYEKWSDTFWIGVEDESFEDVPDGGVFIRDEIVLNKI